LINSAAGDPAKLSCAAGSVPYGLNGGRETIVRGTWANRAAGVRHGDGPRRAHERDVCRRCIARSDVEVLHGVRSPGYCTHDVHGS